MRHCWLKPLLVVLLSLLVVACSEQDKQTAVPATTGKGQPALDFVLQDLSGQSFRLSELRGKVVLLNFWATWCPPCREEMPSMEELYKQQRDRGLLVLAVNSEAGAEAKVRQFVQQNRYSFPVLLDPDAEVQNLYHVFRYPETFIIDRQGRVVEDIVGSFDWTDGPIHELILSLLEG